MPEAQAVAPRRMTFERHTRIVGAPAPASPLAERVVTFLMAGGDILPTQRRQNVPETGERRLAAAVLSVAIADSLWSEDARGWFRGTDARAGYRAALLCEALGLEHGAVIEALEARWRRIGYTARPVNARTCSRHATSGRRLPMVARS